ncbi:hypothetical protein EDD86DRAFT_77611 [Gorgonomyces haynaldii]|nr:hypothetical protein EDD86DRAFT_77611 [Gorgonomyces haynaldii]
MDAIAKLHRTLILKHPYENLSVFHGTKKPSLYNLDEKLSKNSRGGFCLELNQHYGLLLEEMGYTVQRLSAKVILNVPEDDPKANKRDTHILLLVNGHVCDIGASELAPMSPMRLRDGETADGAGGKYLLLKKATWLGKQGWIMQCMDKNKSLEYQNFYFFEEKEYDLEYFEQMTEFVSDPATCPPFPYGLEFITQPTPDGGRKLMIGSEKSGWTFYIRDKEGVDEFKTKTQDKTVYYQLVLEHFGINIHEIDQE